MSGSVMRFMCPFLTVFDQICSGFEPTAYNMERNPDWYVLRNIPRVLVFFRAQLLRFGLQLDFAIFIKTLQLILNYI